MENQTLKEQMNLLKNNVVYCRQCKKFVPFHTIEIIKDDNIKGCEYKYLGEASACDICGAMTYTTENIRNNIDKSYDAYYALLRKEEKKKNERKIKRKLMAKIIAGVVAVVGIAGVLRKSRGKGK